MFCLFFIILFYEEISYVILHRFLFSLMNSFLLMVFFFDMDFCSLQFFSIVISVRYGFGLISVFSFMSAFCFMRKSLKFLLHGFLSFVFWLLNWCLQWACAFGLNAL